MNHRSPIASVLLALSLLGGSVAAFAYSSDDWYGDQRSPASTQVADAGSGSITILSPGQGATLANGSNVKLKYKTQLGPNGNHLHVYVDNNRPIIDHNVHNCPCTLKLPQLSPGHHTVTMKVATVSHALTGVHNSVSFTVK